MTPEQSVAELLTARGETLSTAESCTGGAIAARFTAMAGASNYFLGGVVAYSNEVKINVLGVDPGALVEHGAVSRETAEQMAEGVRRLTGSTYAVATTGIAGPDGGSAQKPVGTVWIAVASPAGTLAECHRFFGDRAQNILQSVDAVLNLLRRAFA